jgi:hypothetical protein
MTPDEFENFCAAVERDRILADRNFDSWARAVRQVNALKKDLENLGCVVQITIGGEIKVAAKKPRTKTDKRKASRGTGKRKI